MTLTENGTSDYVIVRSANAVASEKRAAEELQSYILQISGVNLPIVSDNSDTTKKEIVVGKTNRPCDTLIDRTALGDDGFRIVVNDKTLLIAGGQERGTLYGVYSFLEEYLGCRWFTSTVEYVPQIKTIVIPKDTDNSQTPAFMLRDTSWYCSFDSTWREKQKINFKMLNWNNISSDYTKFVTFAGPVGHTLNYFVPKEEYYETHPEYFMIDVNGERRNAQPCLSNPDVLKLVKQGVKRLIEENPDATLFSVGQNDGGDWEQYCHCPACAAITKEEGSFSGNVIRFVNEVAEYAKTIRKDVKIHTFAYQYTQIPPKITHPVDNVLVQLCAINCNHADIYENTDKAFCDDLKGWSAICKNLFIWDYTTNFNHYLTPVPDFGLHQKNMQLFRDNNAVSMFMQGNSQSINGEFGELRAYIFAKLMWNPDCDLEKVTDEFMLGYYGAGYKNIKKYMNILESRKSDLFKIATAPENIINLSLPDLILCDNLWDAAEKAAADDAQLARIKRSRLQLQYYKSVAQKAEFTVINPLREKSAETLYHSIVDSGITWIQERKQLTKNPDFSKKASTWSE
ncbi:hypothetical protein SDC9_105284 [bioreactor metagenome]|uniref:Alpha glucuronidase N-terminal domain-containing protein n=1 Tax=bioreactor metagenome TaxID=1076179 RepID=A0A645B5N7_9ZZZZ